MWLETACKSKFPLRHLLAGLRIPCQKETNEEELIKVKIDYGIQENK